MTPTYVHAVSIVLMSVVLALAISKRISLMALCVALILISGADMGLRALLIHQAVQGEGLQGTMAVLYRQAPAIVMIGLAVTVAWLMFVTPLRGMFRESQR